jgi:hypothetical protein
MAIGIGLHCWYCDHGPCNGECDTYKSANIYLSEEDKIKNIFKWLSKKIIYLTIGKKFITNS